MLGLVLLAGCGDDDPVVVGPSTTPTSAPAYDPELEPAAAVLPLVPDDATVLEVTDFDQARFQLGFGELSSASDPAVLTRFAQQAATRAPLLTQGMLVGSGYLERYGFSQDDVSWEAHFDGPAGEGYVLAFRDDLDMAPVQDASDAPDGPLSGSVVVPAAHVAALGAVREPEESLAADPVLRSLVGPVAAATYLSTTCVDREEAFGDAAGDLAPTPAALLDDLQELGPFSVTLGARLASARLGTGRGDVFVRARLAADLPAEEFEAAYDDPVADPSTGRIGFRLRDRAAAADLARERRLPFAVCGP
ncbi:hypothetical protein [Nocardioides litoris]|uniref:hypothetical protein n=1 Tax=Nocardioides litoris TaxID=1926648 RepID=UPI001476B934|nr:hypothetical protein [Nocardioides litoris]